MLNGASCSYESMISMTGDMPLQDEATPMVALEQPEQTAAVAVASNAAAELVELPHQQQAEKSNENEKAEEMAADENSEKPSSYAVGARVACLSTWDNLLHSAEIVDRRESKAGVEYYVHYVDYNKRLDEWLPSTRVENWRAEIVPPLKSVMAEKLAPLVIPASPVGASPGAADPQKDTPGATDRKLTRHFKRRYDEYNNIPKPVEELAPLDQTLEKEHEEKTKVKNIQVVELGKYEIDTWYYSPYPEEYAHEHKLYICEFCLKYMKKKKSVERHKIKCELKQPPGDEIYKTTSPIMEPVTQGEPPVLVDSPTISGNEVTGSGRLQKLSMFQVDGKKSKMYCQNLCLLAKLFLDHKTLYYDVDSFLFYILTENDAFGCHLVGYFSKEKFSVQDYNLACILTLPPFQRKGYGRFLISFAYELSKKEGKVGTPERPLSDLGQVSFRSYWTRVLLEILRDHHGNLSIKDLTGMTSIRSEDIIQTLQSLNLIRYWKGQHIISVSNKIIDEHLKSGSPQPNWSIDVAKLLWTPPVTSTARRPR